MDDISSVGDNQAMMAIGIYSFLDSILSRITPALSDDTLHQRDPNGSNSNDFDDSNASPSLTHALFISSLQTPESFMLRRQRIADGRAHENQSSVTTPPTPALRSGNLDNDEEGDVKEVPEPGGYSDDLFIYLSKKEKEEFMCSICYLVIKEAYQCQNEHKFCYGCIHTWSSGRGSGHDCCPMCRCDGLYAKIDELDERIKGKRVRCNDENCNWLGFLREYSGHEHRYYDPKELNIVSSILLDKWQYTPLLKLPSITQFDSCNEFPPHTSPVCLPQSSEHASTVEPLQVRSRTISALYSPTQPQSSFQQLSDDSPQLNSSEQPPLSEDENRPSSQLQVRLGSLTAHPRQNRSELRQPTRLQTLRPLPGALRVSRTTVEDAVLPPSQFRVPEILTSQAQLMPSRRLTPGQLSASQVRISAQPSSNRLIPTSMTAVSGNVHVSTTDVPHNISATITPRLHQATSGVTQNSVRVCMPARNASETTATITQPRLTSPINLPSVGTIHTISPRPRASPGQRRRPAESEPYCNSYGNTVFEVPEKPKLVYRRLVPPQRNDVLEQLRETREQLTAMLNLMTVELEERRRHVISTANDNNMALQDGSHGSANSVLDRLRARRLSAESNIRNSRVETSIQPHPETLNNSSTLGSFNSRSFAIRHLARLHRIELLLNEMNNPASSNRHILQEVTDDNVLHRIQDAPNSVGSRFLRQRSLMQGTETASFISQNTPLYEAGSWPANAVTETGINTISTETNRDQDSDNGDLSNTLEPNPDLGTFGSSSWPSDDELF